MKELSRFQSLPGGLLVLLLFSVSNTSFCQVTVSRLGSLGGSSINAFDLNNTGQVPGNAFTPNNQEQHAVLFQNGGAIDLGTLGGLSATAYALNELGQAVGLSSTAGNTATHAFLYNGTAMVDLGTLGGTISFAVDVNDASQVAGNSYLAGDLVQHAFRVSDGVMQDLGTLGGEYSTAVAINLTGLVVGESALAGDMEVHAFLHDGTGLVDLGTLGGTYSAAQAVNQAGWVVGNATLPFDMEDRGFLHNGNAMIDLGTLGGTYSAAYDLNDSGWVIGDSTTLLDAEYHGFVYGGGVLVDLGTLGGDYSSAWDLNNQGQVVGEALDADTNMRAFLWENGVMTDLNTLLPPGSDWELFSAQFINDNGDIVGVGLFQGQFDWFLLNLGTTGPANNPPVADAGSDQQIECAGDLTQVVLNGSGSQGSDPLVYSWTLDGSVVASGVAPTLALPNGLHELTLLVRDPDGLSSQDTVVVSVQDTTPPTVSCRAAATVEVDEQCTAVVPDFLAGVVANDQCSPAATLVLAQTPAPGTSVGLGVHTVMITAVDQAGLQGSCSVTLEVVDQQAPVVVQIVSQPKTIFPPNNTMVAVRLRARVLDNCGPRPNCQIVAVLKNGMHPGGDAVVTGPMTANLRAVKANKNHPVSYTLVVQCSDGAGNSSTTTVDIPVCSGAKKDKKPKQHRKPRKAKK